MSEPTTLLSSNTLSDPHIVIWFNHNEKRHAYVTFLSLQSSKIQTETRDVSCLCVWSLQSCRSTGGGAEVMYPVLFTGSVSTAIWGVFRTRPLLIYQSESCGCRREIRVVSWFVHTVFTDTCLICVCNVKRFEHLEKRSNKCNELLLLLWSDRNSFSLIQLWFVISLITIIVLSIVRWSSDEGRSWGHWFNPSCSQHVVVFLGKTLIY